MNQVNKIRALSFRTFQSPELTSGWSGDGFLLVLVWRGYAATMWQDDFSMLINFDLVGALSSFNASKVKDGISLVVKLTEH